MTFLVASYHTCPLFLGRETPCIYPLWLYMLISQLLNFVDFVMKTVTCGAGTMCSSDICGPGQHPSIASSSLFGHGCHSAGSVAMPTWVQSWCNNRIKHGSHCPALLDDNLGGYCLDFCCGFVSVFRTCKCNCCKCLKGAGGTCNGGCSSFRCS